MSDAKITCSVCGAQVHAIVLHLREAHPEMTVEEYSEKYPDAPLLSEMAKRRIEERALAKAGEVKMEMAAQPAAEPASNVTAMAPKSGAIKKMFNEAFSLGRAKAAFNPRGEPIPITTLAAHDFAEFVPTASDNYVYDIDELKDVVLAIEMKIPCYVWGHKGAGKTELFEQIAARTNRPMIRVQHTVNTEESHIVGQWTVKGGQTIFELGPLPIAMQNGWMYVADEYDFALPSVLSVYQAVLEGKSLMIKEADAENRLIKPHPHFRFCATGNTNGSGDETGLYQGTNLQNSANYDRFGMVIHKKYMKKAAESQILQNQVGLTREDADKLVEFASLVREAYDGAKISDVISPRTLIYAAKIGVMRASFRKGITLAFINKLSKVDREVVDGLAQRIFGA
jgi:cobaltochelatase CobS